MPTTARDLLNDDLLVAAQAALRVMALWGLDMAGAYAALLAAVDARERADIEAARAMVVEGEADHAG